MALNKCKVCGKKIKKNAVKCTNCGAIIKKTSYLPWIIAIIIFVYMAVHFSDNIKNIFSTDSKKLAMDNVVIDISWNNSSSDKVMNADLTIKNNSPYEIQDFEIICTHYDINGARVRDKNLTIYETISANGQKDINDFNMGIKHPDIKQTECKIIDLIVM